MIGLVSRATPMRAEQERVLASVGFDPKGRGCFVSLDSMFMMRSTASTSGSSR